MLKRFYPLFLSLVVLLCSGCAGLMLLGPVAQIGIMWYEGEAHKYYNTDQETIHRAVKNVLTELNLPITQDKNLKNYIWVKAGDDDRFKIKIHQVRKNITKLSIRVNFMGDKPYAEMIYRHVDRQAGVIDFVSTKQLNTAMKTRQR